MTRRLASPVTRLVACALAALTLSATAAEAVNVRSWDRKIDNVKQRFVVLHAFDDEAVLDMETQLVWQRAPSGVLFTSPLDAADLPGHEAACFNADTGGRYGWRLPSIHELASLLVGPALPPDHPFLNVQTEIGDMYWSATVHLANPTWAMGITFSGVNLTPVRRLTAGTLARAWCVRGPGANSSTY